MDRPASLTPPDSPHGSDGKSRSIRSRMLSLISVESISCPHSDRLEDHLQEFLTRKRPHARTEAFH